MGNGKGTNLSWVDSAVSGVAGIANTMLQNYYEKKRQEQQHQYNMEAARQQQAYNEHNMNLSYQYGEQAANAADARTRALYEDFYGTEAQVRQLKENGLSVGLMYGSGGASGSSSPSGAQGTGTIPLQTHVQPTNALNPMQGVQMDLAWANVQKILAETDLLKGRNSREQGLYIPNKEKLEAETKSVMQYIEEMKANIKNKDAQTALTTFQASYQELQTRLAEQTFEYDVAKAYKELETMRVQYDMLVNNRDIQDATKDDLIKQVGATLEKTVQDTLLAKAQTELAKENKKLTTEQIKQVQDMCKQIGAMTTKINEETKFIEDRFILDCIVGGANALGSVFDAILQLIPSKQIVTTLKEVTASGATKTTTVKK